MFSRVIFLSVFSTSFLSALGLTCLSCKEIAHPRYCHVVAECGASQRCFAKSITTTDQRKAYELGCTDQHTLDSTECNTTKVDVNGQGCFGCCTNDLCNAALCGEQDYPVNRGSICYSCDSRERGEPCNQVAFCRVGEVCSIEERVEFSTAIYIAECRPKHVCESHGLAIIGKRSVREEEPLDLEIDPDLGNCHKCCSEDLCNTVCSPRVNTDYCQTNPCLNGGSCHNNQSGYDCICPSGWLGKNCHIVDYCQTNPCMNGGSCHNNQSGYVCTCPSGWLGKNCNIVDHCKTNPCLNGGSCFNNQSGYVCTCPTGWLGKNCEIVDCGNVSHIPHANISYRNGKTYSSTADISCDTGYDLNPSSSSQVTCLSSGSWSSPIPTCVPKDCGNVSHIPHANISYRNGTTYSSTADISCDTGYDLNPSSSSQVTCLSSGRWSSPIPTCVPKDRCSVKRPCKYGSTCLNNGSNYSCVCPPGLTGRHCDIGFDCSSFSGANMTSNNSDIYQLWMPQQHLAKRVVCDVTTDGGGWLVIQRRFNGSVSFYRNFSEYEQGFGELSGEFWMGLRDVHEVLSCGTWEIRFNLEDAEGLTGYQTYQEFRLAPTPKYTLHIGLSNGTANRKKGVSSSGFSYNNGRDFSTYDYGPSTDCGIKDRGGWWYYHCAFVNINGEYLHPPGRMSSFNSGERGMTYHSFDDYRTLKSTEMKIRRVSGSVC